MLILLLFLAIIIVAGVGFAIHVFWFVALVFFVFWLVGFALGRGERSGRHNFYRW